jgi:hypothetical protein
MPNIVLVHLHLEEGCSQDEDEVDIQWKPVNFMVYSDLFQDMIYEAVDEYLSDITLKTNEFREVMFKHIVDRDGGGAVLGEWFVPLILKEAE